MHLEHATKSAAEAGKGSYDARTSMPENEKKISHTRTEENPQDEIDFSLKILDL